jgi:hypothetical protein
LSTPRAYCSANGRSPFLFFGGTTVASREAMENAVFQFYNCAALKPHQGRMQAQALHCGNQTG